MGAQVTVAGKFYEDLAVGQTASRSNTVTALTIAAFADVSGDRNPVHLDSAYAATTLFKEPIAHGMLSAAYISAVIGMDLPGPGAIYVSQSLSFKAPVKAGDTVVALVRIVELLPKRRVRLGTLCTVDDKPVVEGEAVMLVPARTV